ncbi:MAG: 30S ribosomal protein S8e [Candidatus Parvarchaeota archaeon]|jgi:small subunit ribosomal protein S8e|nr:30S ribosomal protein S8e [Candidatus Parvarchaeota archaeon]
MSKSTSPSLKKRGGGFKGKRRDKRKSETIATITPVQVGEIDKRVYVRTLGGNRKVRLLHAKTGNMFDSVKKTTSKVTLIKVIKNESNRSYARRNIITKGSVIETSDGNGIVVNRPGQSGQVSLIKLEK